MRRRPEVADGEAVAARTIGDSRSGRRARWSALDDVVNLEDVRRVGELDAGAGEDRHQTLAEGLELLPRVPDFADLKVAIQTEADVVVEPARWPFAGVLDLANRLVVLLGSESDGTEADNDTHDMKLREGSRIDPMCREATRGVGSGSLLSDADQARDARRRDSPAYGDKEEPNRRPRSTGRAGILCHADRPQ